MPTFHTSINNQLCSSFQCCSDSLKLWLRTWLRSPPSWQPFWWVTLCNYNNVDKLAKTETKVSGNQRKALLFVDLIRCNKYLESTIMLTLLTSSLQGKYLLNIKIFQINIRPIIVWLFVQPTESIPLRMN